MTLARIIGERIAEDRHVWNLTQRALAEQVGIGQSAIGLYEKGDRMPPLPVLIRIAAAFGMTISQFLTGLEEEIGECQAASTND